MKQFAMVLMMAALLNGCSTSRDISDEALAGDPVAMLADGKRLIIQGESLVRSGEEKLADGREQVNDGELQIDAGTDRVAATRAKYQQRARRSGQAGSPKAVEAEAAEMREIGDEWQDAIDDIREGSALVEKGNRNIDRGQSEIREGRQLMERGGTLVQDSERMWLGEDVTLVPAAASGR